LKYGTFYFTDGIVRMHSLPGWTVTYSCITISDIVCWSDFHHQKTFKKTFIQISLFYDFEILTFARLAQCPSG